MTVEEGTMAKQFPLFFCALALCSSAQAGWQEDMDLLSAGAAASVVAMHSCNGEMYSLNANQYAATRLKHMAQGMEDPDEAYEYAVNAFESKVNAMWQSSDGQCSQVQRLVDIARSTGFLAPSGH